MINQSFTIEELKNRCGVSETAIKEFLSCRRAAGGYHPRFSEDDIKQLGEFLALGSIGFSANQRKDYLKLSERQSGAAEKMQMLGNQRQKLLNKVHEMEKQISRIDYLKHELGNNQPEPNPGTGENRSRGQGRNPEAESETKFRASPGPKTEAKP